MAYTLVYHPEVKAKDVPTLNRDVAKRIQRAIENRPGAAKISGAAEADLKGLLETPRRRLSRGV